MAKITDLRALSAPSMTVVLPDDLGTTVHVTAPTLELVEYLRENAQGIFGVLRGEEGDERMKQGVYDFAAKLINCNLDGFNTSAHELATKYSMNMQHLQVFFTDYVDFVSEIQNAKN